MNDLLLAPIWVLVLAVGLALGVQLRKRGVPTTYVRDLLHVGAGIWVIGWPWWNGVALPIAIVVAAFLATAALPKLPRFRPLVDAISGGDESWSGIVGYTASFAIFTALGLAGDPFPSAIALWSLALGDGLGGLAGRKLGRIRIRAPFAKAKTLEGSLVVFAGALAAVYLAASLFDREVGLGVALSTALVAALSEAIAPRSTDNLFVPLATWSVAALMVS